MGSSPGLTGRTSSFPNDGRKKMTTLTRHWTFSERVFLSLYGGFSLPFLYLVAAIFIAGVLGSRLGARGKEWLALPLVWPAHIVEALYHPRIEAVGDVLEAAFVEFMVIVLVNFLICGLGIFLLLSILNQINGGEARLKVQSST
jgi:hypothetical protein